MQRYPMSKKPLKGSTTDLFSHKTESSPAKVRRMGEDRDNKDSRIRKTRQNELQENRHPGSRRSEPYGQAWGAIRKGDEHKLEPHHLEEMGAEESFKKGERPFDGGAHENHTGENPQRANPGDLSHRISGEFPREGNSTTSSRNAGPHQLQEENSQRTTHGDSSRRTCESCRQMAEKYSALETVYEKDIMELTIQNKQLQRNCDELNQDLGKLHPLRTKIQEYFTSARDSKKLVEEHKWAIQELEEKNQRIQKYASALKDQIDCLQLQAGTLNAEKGELQFSNQKMQETILELTSRGGVEQKGDDYLATQFGSLSSSINQWSTTNFATKSAFSLKSLNQEIPRNSPFYHLLDDGMRLQNIRGYIIAPAVDAEGIFSDPTATLPRTKIINGAVSLALYCVNCAHYPFIGVPSYRERLFALTELCGGSPREKQRFFTLGVNLITKSPEFESEQRSALEKMAAELDSLFAPLASPKSNRDPQKRYSRLLRILQSFAQITLETAQQQDALYTIVNNVDASHKTEDGFLFAPPSMSCTDGKFDDNQLLVKKATIQIVEFFAVYKRRFTENGEFEEKATFISPMKVSCNVPPKQSLDQEQAARMLGGNRDTRRGTPTNEAAFAGTDTGDVVTRSSPPQ